MPQKLVFNLYDLAERTFAEVTRIGRWSYSIQLFVGNSYGGIPHALTAPFNVFGEKRARRVATKRVVKTKRRARRQLQSRTVIR